jgi:hypothetical protein
MSALIRRSKRTHTNNTFAASLKDIEKALEPSRKLDLTSLVPQQYHAFKDVFQDPPAGQLPPSRPGVDMTINLEKDNSGREKSPPWGPLYSMSRDELLVLQKTLLEYLDKGYIRASQSPAASPVLFAKKPGGGLRFCVDYCGINQMTIKDRYPLPLIKETLHQISQARWITKLDVKAAFHKIRMAAGEEWKTAFRTRYGLYEWKVVLCNGPSVFQRYVNWALRKYLDEFASAYVDDILIYTNGSRAEHRQKVNLVLQELSRP